MTWGSVHGPACDDDLIASLQAGQELLMLLLSFLLGSNQKEIKQHAHEQKREQRL